jgi:hypothetical protein
VKPIGWEPGIVHSLLTLVMTPGCTVPGLRESQNSPVEPLEARTVYLDSMAYDEPLGLRIDFSFMARKCYLPCIVMRIKSR